jgi:hypothetical protein
MAAKFPLQFTLKCPMVTLYPYVQQYPFGSRLANQACRSNGGRLPDVAGAGAGDCFCAAHFLDEDIVGFDGCVKLFNEEFVRFGELFIALGELIYNVASGGGSNARLSNAVEISVTALAPWKLFWEWFIFCCSFMS